MNRLLKLSICLFLGLVLSFGLAGVAGATIFVADYQDEPGEGYFNDYPVAPIDGNPGTTLGGQRQYVFEHGLKLLSRVVWVPNTIELPVEAEVWAVGGNFLGGGGSSILYGAGVPTGEDYGLRADVDYYVGELAILTGGQSLQDLSEQYTNPKFGHIYMSNRSGWSLSTNYSEGDRFSWLPIILHEGLHMFGFSSLFGYIGEPIGSQGIIRKQKNYDRFVRHLGADVEVPADMTVEQQRAMAYGGDNVVFVGERTRAHSLRLMPEGYDADGNVLLYAKDEGDPDGTFLSTAVSHVDMHNHPDHVENLMAPASGFTLELGIAAYMLSDMGHGPVVDSSVSSSGTNINSVSITTQALVSDLVEIPNDQVQQVAVTIVLPEGLSFGSFLSDPAECLVDDANPQRAVCTYGQMLINTPSMIDVGLVGEDGAYTVEIDVEHQDMHVDGVPVNNFFSANVVMGVNPLSNFALSAPAIEADTDANAVVGSLSVENSSDDEVVYSLIDDAADGLFVLSGSDVVATSALSAANNGIYAMTVQAMTGLGFALESTFTLSVSINPVTNLAFNSSTITRDASLGDVVGTLSADHALGESVTFTLSEGVADNADFGIDGASVTTQKSLSRSDNGTYSLSVVASDGDFSIESTVTVTVNIPAPVAATPPSSGGGGGCTVASPGQSDGSLPLLVLALSLMLVRRRFVCAG